MRCARGGFGDEDPKRRWEMFCTASGVIYPASRHGILTAGVDMRWAMIGLHGLDHHMDNWTFGIRPEVWNFSYGPCSDSQTIQNSYPFSQRSTVVRKPY